MSGKPGRNSVVSWNVNSIRVREAQVREWIEQYQPAVVGLQETKVPNDVWPGEAFESLGYHTVSNGQRTYNGVAFISREPAEDLVFDLPGFDDPQRRVLAGTFGDLRVINLYVPNGQAVGSEKYEYKLSWLAHLHDWLKEEMARHDKVVVMGDFNIAPKDEDVHDPEAWRGKILFSEPEHAALGKLLDLGLDDSFRLFDQEPEQFSWWDFRTRAFRRNRGLRIDLALTSHALRNQVEASWIDIEPRKAERPSDHAPVGVNIEP
ncbi:exodeoxyribonuclease III [Natronospira bacteriovora]|uniref:Exodeoxyribonuclease III n=1 Tax=Natronospira bacteriovora TaxID=3069753 RepID=A0ABU0W6T3_9GAMM|nr:exodeoxyribonuclease III [Natronospira sp. AB-CW4]MDQ2069711.1 exodeoxyribonuclease III [Natronospira sp. AB-CW4]